MCVCLFKAILGMIMNIKLCCALYYRRQYIGIWVAAPWNVVKKCIYKFLFPSTLLFPINSLIRPQKRDFPKQATAPHKIPQFTASRYGHDLGRKRTHCGSTVCKNGPNSDVFEFPMEFSSWVGFSHVSKHVCAARVLKGRIPAGTRRTVRDS